MQVFLAAGGFFHAHHMARELKARDSLWKFVTPANLPEPLRRELGENLWHVPLLAKLESLIGRLPGLRTALPPWRWKDANIAQLAAALLKPPADLAVLFACYALPGLLKARKMGIASILERSSVHIERQLEMTGGTLPRWVIDWQVQEYAAADRISVPSRLVAESFVRSGIPEKKLIVLPLGYDPVQFPRQAVAHRPFRILFVGAVSRQKGVHTLIDAWNRLDVSAELTLIGAPQADGAEFLRASKKSFRHLDLIAQEDLPRHYASSSVLVLPSLQDGFGLVALEAMGSGLPVIVSDKCGVAELVTSGDDGLVVPAGDAAALTGALMTLYNDERLWSRMSQNAFRKAQAHTWSRYGDTLVKAYRECLGEKGVH